MGISAVVEIVLWQRNPLCSSVFFLCVDTFLACEIEGPVLETFLVSSPPKLADTSMLKGKSGKGEQFFVS